MTAARAPPGPTPVPARTIAAAVTAATRGSFEHFISSPPPRKGGRGDNQARPTAAGEEETKRPHTPLFRPAGGRRNLFLAGGSSVKSTSRDGRPSRFVPSCPRGSTCPH